MPHDVVILPRDRSGRPVNQGQDREENVEPLPEDIADVRAWKEGLTVNSALDTDGKPLKPASSLAFLVSAVSSITSSWSSTRSRNSSAVLFPTTWMPLLAEQLVAAEQVLASAVRFLRLGQARLVA